MEENTKILAILSVMPGGLTLIEALPIAREMAANISDDGGTWEFPAVTHVVENGISPGAVWGALNDIVVPMANREEELPGSEFQLVRRDHKPFLEGNLKKAMKYHNIDPQSVEVYPSPHVRGVWFGRTGDLLVASDTEDKARRYIIGRIIQNSEGTR